jgi:serine/threonine protein kinase
MIDAYLPIHREVGDRAWQWKDDTLANLAEPIGKTLNAPDSIAAGDILKQDTNRFIIRHHTDMPSPSSVVVKTFPMAKLKQRLWRYKRYGPTETANLIEALKRGLPVPELFGCFSQRRAGMTLSTGLVIEDFVGARSVLDELSSNPFTSEISAALCQLLVKLHNCGCNHIDLNLNNIFLGETGELKLIDFMYVAYHDCGSTRILAFQTAYVINGLTRCGASDEQVEGLIDALVDELALTRSEFATIVQSFQGRKLPRKERLELA